MLCRKFHNILLTKPSNSNAIYRPLVQTRSFSKWFHILSGTNMASTNRLKVFRDLFFSRVLNVWTRSYMVNSVFKRCMTEKGMNKMFLYFRQVFFRPRTQLLVSATATIKNTEEKPGPPKKCQRNIKDKEMRRLIKDLDRVEDLSRETLFCPGCDKRIVVDIQHKGIQYCECPDAGAPVGTYDGWVPYMEAEDIIIWRKEYKPGPLYAYKVYGRYKHIKAEDFAMIQVDGTYRKIWDTAVASISIVESEANGVKDQTVLHWEVLWPRLFANRDYVYLRRHKEFNVTSRCLVHKDRIFPDRDKCVPDKKFKDTNKCNVHARAKAKSQEMDKKEDDKQRAKDAVDNKVYVIVSRSCVHPEVPHSKNAVRVMEYWSHMVITTLNGPDRPGMEFVLTYYDEPSVGGLPTAVTSWAMGRAGPAFLARMRQAAQQYAGWRHSHKQPPDFAPFGATEVEFDRDGSGIAEEDMPSYEQGPDINEDDPVTDPGTSENSTQTMPVIITPIEDPPRDGPKLEAEASAQLKHATKQLNKFEMSLVLKQDDCNESEKGPGDIDTINQVNMSKILPSEIGGEKNQLEQVDNTQQSHTTSEMDKLTENIIDNKNMNYDDNSMKKFTTNVKIQPLQNVNIVESDKDSANSEEERDDDSIDEQDQEKKYSFWRYLYPLYYFGWQ